MINTDRKVLVDRLGRRQFWGELFGWMVGVGLVVEYWQEIVECFTKRQLPPLPLVGGLVVTLGVLGEVWFSRLASKTAEEISERADSDVALAKKGAAEAYERALNAEKEAAEANLARAKLEQRMRPRMILGPESDKFKELLIPHAGKWVDIMVFDQHVQEATNLAWQFLSLFRSAGWNVRMWEPIGNTHPIPGASLLVPIGIDAPIEFLKLAIALSDRIRELDIECNVAPGSFGEVNKPWNSNADPKRINPFRLVKEEPLRIFGHKTVSPFRIQIGALQLVPVSPTRILIAKPGPKA
jgi:hypothetical protein